VKNSKNNNNTGLMLEMAIAHLQNTNINSNGLLEVIMKTENPDLALAFLSGKYVQPNFAHKVIIKDDVVCTFVVYNPWEDRITYSYERQKTKRIYIPSSVKEEDVNAETYKQFEVSWSSNGDTKAITVTLLEKEEVMDNCYSTTWNDATVISENDFVPPFPDEDVF
jgi:hypothetical protein